MPNILNIVMIVAFFVGFSFLIRKILLRDRPERTDQE